MVSSANGAHVINNILAVNLKLMKFVGLWQGNTSTLKVSWATRLYTIYRWAILCVMYLHTATEYMDIVFTWGDLENLAANGSVTLIYTTCMIKVTIFLLYEKRLQNLVQSMQSGHLATSLRWTKHHYRILNDADCRAQTASWRYYYLAIVCIIFFFVTAILRSYGTAFGLDAFREGNQTVKTLVFKAWFPFDIQQSGYFEIAFSFQIISCTMGPAINAGMDTLLVSVIINCCGEFRVLKYSLGTIKERAEDLLTLEECSEGGNSKAPAELESKENVRREETGPLAVNPGISGIVSGSQNNENPHEVHPQEYMDLISNRCLTECAHHHQLILELVANLENLQSPVLFIQFCGSTCTICLILFYLALNMDADEIMNQLSFCALMSVALTQLLLFCWYGNDLTYESDSLTKAIYDTPWYDGSLHFRKTVGIMISRSMKPSYLTGGKLYIVSLETYIAIIRASFSYYTVLRNMNKP